MEKTPALWLVQSCSWRCAGVSSVRQMRWSTVLHNSALFRSGSSRSCFIIFCYVALNTNHYKSWTSWAEHLLQRCCIIASDVPVILSIRYFDCANWFSTKVVLAESFEFSYFSSVNTVLLLKMWIQLVSTSAPEWRTFMWFQMFLSNYSDGTSVCL